MSSIFGFKKDIPDKSFLRRAAGGAAILGVLAFWGGMLMAAQRYPSEYDWRYIPVSNLVSADDNPAGYVWASTGIVLCSLCGLCWTAVLGRRRYHGEAGKRPSGIGALRFGNICMMGAAVLPRRLLGAPKDTKSSRCWRLPASASEWFC
jgi:hypothetical protein